MHRTTRYRKTICLAAGLLIPACLCLAQPRRKPAPPDSTSNGAPAPTISSGAAGVKSVSDDSGSGDASVSQAATAALQRYRQMWQRMTPAQQKVFVQRGGRTPEDFERTLKESASHFAPGRTEGPRSTAAARESDPRETGKAINPGDLDSISKSLQDLNAIRDGNLARVQKDGCPPEVASRVAELRSKLQAAEFERNGGRPPAPPPTAGSAKSGQADPIAIASDWFKRPADQKSGASDSGNGNARGGALLDDVLLGAEPASAAANPKIAANSPESVQQRNALQEDITRIKTELAQLSGACADPKK
jgi:hypothetical protein